VYRFAVILNFRFESRVPAVEIYRRERHTRTQRHRGCGLAVVHYVTVLDIWCETDARSKLRVRPQLRSLLVVGRANPESGLFVAKYHPMFRVGPPSIVHPLRSFGDRNGLRANVSGVVRWFQYTGSMRVRETCLLWSMQVDKKGHI
jgi:hypothetical protein